MTHPLPKRLVAEAVGTHGLDNASEQCPIFPGKTKRIHWSFDDPAAAEGDEEFRLTVFRRVRDETLQRLRLFVEGQSYV